MDSQEDPEQRIRELERSLGDVAGASELTRSSSELGSGPAGPPTLPFGPPPTAPFGAPPTAPFTPPFPPLRSTPSAGVNVRWVVLGLVTVVTVGIIVGSAVWASNLFSDVTSLISPSGDRPTVSGGGGPFGEPASRTAANPPSLIPTREASGGEPTVGPVPGGDFSVSGVGENKTIACNDGAIGISGVSNRVVLTGHCASVTVSGIENVVEVDASDTISASGIDNHVTFRSGSPVIENSGSSNVVEQG